jgi:hypothetical protein
MSTTYMARMATTVGRIREIQLADQPLRSALGMIEFELSGRDGAPFARSTVVDVRCVRLLATAYLFAGPRETLLKTMGAAEDFVHDRHGQPSMRWTTGDFEQQAGRMKRS